MDIVNISMPQGTSFTGQSTVGTRAPQQSQTQNFTPKTETPETAELARYEAILKAAQSVQANYYAVSDVRFTIFKDVAGDYVTRFTSLKDGSVKYYPQKTLFETVQIRNAEIAVYDNKA